MVRRNINIQFLQTKMLSMYVTKVVCIICMSSIAALPVDVRVAEVCRGSPLFLQSISDVTGRYMVSK